VAPLPPPRGGAIMGRACSGSPSSERRPRGRPSNET
jgi:hypothetical protein